MYKLLRTVVAIGEIRMAMIGLIAPIVALVILSSAVPVRAHLSTFVAVINSGQEVPPNTSNAIGTAFVTVDVDTGQLCFSITFTPDLLTSPETAAHFHSPAKPGVNADIVVPLPLGSPKNGCAPDPLTPEQIADLNAGLWYVNVHTETNPGGEIRGQVNITNHTYP